MYPRRNILQQSRWTKECRNGPFPTGSRRQKLEILASLAPSLHVLDPLRSELELLSVACRRRSLLVVDRDRVNHWRTKRYPG